MAEPIDEAVLAALAQPIRMALLVALEQEGESTPEALAPLLDVTEGQVHQHVATLHELGLVVDGATPRHLRVARPGWATVAAQIRHLQRVHAALPPLERDD
ncbi:hypothetical protein DSM104299_04974 [Baekduia alba]|uniref:winged helix-turn-helix domain-containing protein n=1 Tax=Baekduia alba TaxID=2997333 RepID=UPI0023415BE0|nr:winged helix-turn-helix domain-containing protein [Baekduia alba]WCB96218.1 hypothetical protein DSM104299_04974 [Baekduia alba]